MARFAGCQTWCFLHVFQNREPALSHRWKSDTIQRFILEADCPVGGDLLLLWPVVRCNPRWAALPQDFGTEPFPRMGVWGCQTW
jgi:hypothetical protein